MRVLVSGACGPAGRSLFDQLSARRIDVVGCDMAAHPRRDAPVLQVLPATHPHYVDQLRSIIAEHRIDLFIPTVSEELTVVAASKVPQAVIASASAVTVANDKWLTLQTLAGSHVPVPLATIEPDLDPARQASFGTPLVVKPRVSRGGRGVRLLTTWPTALEQGDVVNEFVPGQEYAVDVHLGERNEVVVLRKTELKSGDHGNAIGVQRVDCPDVTALALRACQAIGLRGPADLDVRRRANGEPVVLEINARFGAHSAHAPEILTAVLAEAGREAAA